MCVYLVFIPTLYLLDQCLPVSLHCSEDEMFVAVLIKSVLYALIMIIFPFGSLSTVCVR